LVIFFRFCCVTAQVIKIQTLEEYDKIAKIDLGDARVTQSYKHLLHKINTQDLSENIMNFETALNKLEEVRVSDEIINGLRAKTDQLKTKINTLLTKERKKEVR